ncbi:hypothetical protein [Halostella litorea]|uniref:hypothetical protein n=1 Tax=Halostella litorea TaxID=2528831 RepID=UPI00109266D1|nr:hypothetical protein [Halostella litorea]
MAERSVADLVEDWQSGALLVFACALVGVVFGSIMGSLGSGPLGLAGFAIGSVLAFLAFSYLRYGR